jgi:hypothetical protein
LRLQPLGFRFFSHKGLNNPPQRLKAAILAATLSARLKVVPLPGVPGATFDHSNPGDQRDEIRIELSGSEVPTFPKPRERWGTHV